MIKLKNILILSGILLTHSFALLAESKSVNILSPDGLIKGEFFIFNGLPMWSMSYKSEKIILPSNLGITGYQDNLEIKSFTESSSDTIWYPVYGERSVVRDHYNESEITFSRNLDPGKQLKLIIRAYNEGIAFRYYFPGNEYLHITNEYTEYTLPEDTKAYFTPRAQAVYQLLPLKGWPGECERPLVLERKDAPYVLLTEAEVVNYVRTKFVLSLDKVNTIIGKMYGEVDDIAPYKTPWRVVMVAEKPGDLIENNDLLLNLNPPSEIENPWWITPGKVMREITLSTEGAKNVVDFAVKHNIQYIHFDAGWYGPEGLKQSDATTVSLDPARNPDPDALNLMDAIAYAKKHSKKVILYVNQRALFQQLDEILPLYKSWGVDGIKFGFVQVGSYFWTHWLHEAVKKCAEHGLVVDIHDEYRPTGFSRTYPNLLTQEGIYGNEEFPDATNNTTLPFTRFTQGAADYTICYYRQKFDSQTKTDTNHGLVNARFLKTTSAHQLALSVVYYSPLQFMYWYDKPSDIRDEPELEFFDAVPTVWDDTKVLHGEIGEYITIARRSGDKWFVGTITNNDKRKLTIPLEFLDKEKKYVAHIYYDDPKAPGRTKVGIKRINVTALTKLSTDLFPSGGQAILIKEQL